MNIISDKKHFPLTLGTFVVLSYFFSLPALAEKFIVFSHYQEVPAKSEQLSEVIDKEVIKKLSNIEGLIWKGFYYDAAVGKRGSVLVWRSETDWDAYLKSDLRKALVNKMRPFLQGPVTSKGYPIYKPKS